MRRPQFLTRLSQSTLSWIAAVIKWETLSGVLLLVAAVAALVVANSPLAADYFALREIHVGPAALHLDLSIHAWAADFLLAIFFLVIGIELRHELTVGSLNDRSAALVPVAAAVGGMIFPAAIFVAFTTGTPAVAGWGIPLATDIAFALAVLALVGKRLPVELRAFLLTLAVVDDLGAILIIAIFYTASVNFVSLGIAAVLLAAFAVLQARRVRALWLYIPLGLAAWAFLHDSGVHATIAGVIIGLAIRSTRTATEHHSPAERAIHVFHPLSAYIAVPVFAFMSAGVSLATTPLGSVASSPAAWGIIVGLVIGKPLGITIVAWVALTLFNGKLGDGVRWADIAAIGVVSGIGFTVSLLIAELAFADQPEALGISIAAVLIASAIAASAALVFLASRGRRHAAGYELRNPV